MFLKKRWPSSTQLLTSLLVCQSVENSNSHYLINPTYYWINKSLWGEYMLWTIKWMAVTQFEWFLFTYKKRTKKRLTEWTFSPKKLCSYTSAFFVNISTKKMLNVHTEHIGKTFTVRAFYLLFLQYPLVATKASHTFL